MSNSTPPPPEPEPVTRPNVGVGPQDSLAPNPFVSASIVQQVEDFFGVLIGYNEAQSDLLSEQAATIGRLERAAEVSSVNASASIDERFGEQVGLLRQLFTDEREYLVDQVAVFEALKSDDVDSMSGELALISAVATERMAFIDHEIHSLNSAERVISDLKLPDADIMVGARRLGRINDDLTVGNEHQIVGFYSQEVALGLGHEHQPAGRLRSLDRRLLDASGYAVVTVAGVGIVLLSQPAIGLAALTFGGLGTIWALTRRVSEW